MRWIALTALLVATQIAAAEADKVVIITSAASGIRELSSIELRKIYFGFPLTKNGIRFQAIRYPENSELEQIFLQNVVSVSRRDYERRLLILATQSGRRRPVIAESSEAAIDLALRNPGIVTYALLSQISSHIESGRLVVLREIWQSD